MSILTQSRRNLTLSGILNNGIFDRLRYGDGENIFIVDTGVFIDLDYHFYGNGRTGKNPSTLLTRLEENYPILVTERVMGEITDHRNRKMKINNRDEVSEPTAVLANRLHESTKEYLEQIGFNYLTTEERDLHRFCVRLAAQEAFKTDHRKGYKDKISDTDIEIISHALDIWLCGHYSLENLSAVNILSTDEHIARTVNFLKYDPQQWEGDFFDQHSISSHDFQEYGIRVIPTRGNLSSYMTK